MPFCCVLAPLLRVRSCLPFCGCNQCLCLLPVCFQEFGVRELTGMRQGRHMLGQCLITELHPSTQLFLCTRCPAVSLCCTWWRCLYRSCLGFTGLFESIYWYLFNTFRNFLAIISSNISPAPFFILLPFSDSD